MSNGVPLGLVLSPLLFVVCVNDLDDNVVNSFCKFADYTIFYDVMDGEEDSMSPLSVSEVSAENTGSGRRKGRWNFLWTTAKCCILLCEECCGKERPQCTDK